MADPFIGEIKITAWNYPPRNWALCAGSTLAIATNNALFSLLGTSFGGNGVSTFNLPDLRGRAPMGSGPSTPPGATDGVESYALIPQEMPKHTHALAAASSTGNVANPAGMVLAAGLTNGYSPLPPPATQSTLDPSVVSTVGANAAHENRQPFLCMNFIIALAGIFPSRN
jgi:microcystin-dependent protein